MCLCSLADSITKISQCTVRSLCYSSGPLDHKAGFVLSKGGAAVFKGKPKPVELGFCNSSYSPFSLVPAIGTKKKKQLRREPSLRPVVFFLSFVALV